MTNYFFYNTDADSLVAAPRPRYQTLIAQGFAATGGPRRYGEQLSQLAPGDTLLMYENRIGIVAIGTVLKQWDGISHENMLYYKNGEGCIDDHGQEREYRIKVEWQCLPRAISVKELRRQFGYTPRGTVRRIVKRRAQVDRMIAEAQTP